MLKFLIIAILILGVLNVALMIVHRVKKKGLNKYRDHFQDYDKWKADQDKKEEK